MALDLTKTFAEVFGSERSTGQTCIDSDGNLKWAQENLVDTRLDDSGEWTQTGLTSVAESGTDAAGEIRYLLTEDTASSTHTLARSAIYVAGRTYTHKLVVKSAGRDFQIALSPSVFGAAIRYSYVFSTESLVRQVAGTNDSCVVTPLGGGEFSVELTADATASSGGSVVFYLSNGATGSYTGDGTSGIYISQPHVYQSSVGPRPELVTNGDFASDLSGWSQEGSDFTWSSGVASGSATGGTVTALWQAITTVVGQRYRFAYTISGVANLDGSDAYANIRSTGFNSGTEVTNQTISAGNGTYIVEFTAVTTTSYVSFKFTASSEASDAFSVDNVSVIPVPDAMQRNNKGSTYLPNTTGAALYHCGVAHDANGAVIGGQFFEGRTQLTTYPTITTANWSDVGGITSTDLTENALGAFPGVKIASGGALTDALKSPNTPSVTSGTKYAVTAIWEDGDSGLILFRLDESTVSSSQYTVATDGTLSAIATTKGTATLSRHVEIAAGIYETTLLWTPNFTGTADYALGPYSSTATEFINVYAGSFMVGASHTPFIPANGSSITRGADSFPKATSTFGYNQTEGFVVAEFQSAGSDGADTPFIFIADDGTANNRLAAYLNTSNAAIAASTVSGVAQAAESAGSYTPDALSKIAYGMNADDFAVSLDGGTIATDTSGTMAGSVTNFEIGTGLNGYIKRLIYCPFKPDNATIVEEAT